MRADDPATMQRMRTWLHRVATDLDLDPAVIDEAEQPLLDLIAVVAHGPSRPGAPLTAFLVGVAVGQGGDAGQLSARLAEVASEWTGDETP